MENIRIAVLITCHNRQAKTLACLQALSVQNLSTNIKLKVYLVDDGSTDGTAEVVVSNYPEVQVLSGNGNLFWNGGMRLAFAEAIKDDYDFYLWLNDDTTLYPHALESLLATSNDLSNSGHNYTVIVGSTQDQETGTFTYGGMIRKSWWHPLKFTSVEPGNQTRPCLTMNGNCVLISRNVVKVIGNLDPNFIHSTGDIDYGLRVQKNGGSVWLAPGYLGTCDYNPLRQQAWNEAELTFKERWQKINQPRGLPVKEWRVFSRRYAGLLWFIYWLLPYARLFLRKSYKNI